MAKKTIPTQKQGNPTPEGNPNLWQKVTGATDPNETDSDKTARGVGGIGGGVVGLGILPGKLIGGLIGGAALGLVSFGTLTHVGVIIGGIAGTAADAAIGVYAGSRGAVTVVNPEKRETVVQKVRSKFNL